MATKAKDELITVREAAKSCQRNAETIRRWIWSGKLTAQKLGNQLFIRKADLDSFQETMFCREKAVKEYKAEPKEDFLKQAIRFRSKLKTRGYKPIDAAELVRKSREGRMRELRQSLR